MTDDPRQKDGAGRSSALVRWTRKWARLVVCLLVVVVAAALGGPQAWAWSELRQGRSALERHQPEVAHDHLARCLTVWPGSTEARLLASRAARQSGDLDKADRHLRACQRLLGGTSDDVALEWALLQAAGGNPREVEEYLQYRAEADPRQAPLIWEALVEGYIRIYRILDALAFLEHWLSVAPDDLRALELRGTAYRQGRSSAKAAESFRRVLELDPSREEARWPLALCLLDMGSYQEAVEQLERIDRRRGGDPDVRVRLARAYNMLDREDEARALLLEVLHEHPGHGQALRALGQIALMRRRPAEAEPWLRKAASAMPDDYQSHWFLFQALSQLKRTKEAEVVMRQAERLRDRAARLGELRSRRMSEQPLDPALHVEMGVLLLRSRDDLGERWLHSALSLDPRFAPAHAALADLYQRRGDVARAEEHRRQAQAGK
jgi:tetratricopeptide (TPR) repeat protein